MKIVRKKIKKPKASTSDAPGPDAEGEYEVKIIKI